MIPPKEAVWRMQTRKTIISIVLLAALIMAAFLEIVPTLINLKLDCMDDGVSSVRSARGFADFVLENSVYGDPHNIHFQCAYVSRDLTSAGWYWYKPFLSARPYWPDIIFRPQAAVPPITMDSLSTFKIWVTASVNATGRLNLILDLYFGNDSHVISDELMVFLLRQGQGMDTREFMSDGYNRYSYFSFKSDTVRIHVFAVDSLSIPSIVDIRAMLDHMASKGYKPTYFLNASLGDEIFQGRGATRISRYGITLNEQTFDAFTNPIAIAPGTAGLIQGRENAPVPQPIITEDHTLSQSSLGELFLFSNRSTLTDLEIYCQ